MHASLVGQSQTEAELKYLDTASKLARYGFTYFLVEDSNGEVYLGLSKPGITLSKKSSVQIPVKKIRKTKQPLYKFEDILHWKSESSTVELSIKTDSGKAATKEIILFAKSVLQSTTIVDLINGYYKLRNMYNNEDKPSLNISKIQPKVNDISNGTPAGPNNINPHDSKTSNSPSTSPADRTDLSCDNKNNIQGDFDEEYEEDNNDDEEDDNTSQQSATEKQKG